MNHPGEVLGKIRESRNITQADAAQHLTALGFDTSLQSVSRFERGISHMDFERVFVLCELYGIDDMRGTFSAKRNEPVLNGAGLAVVAEFVEWVKSRPEYRIRQLIKLPLHELPVSAGTGQESHSLGQELMAIDGVNVPDCVTELVRVAGDSMEPEFSHGDILLMEPTKFLRTGDIGCFLYDGSTYVKIFEQHGGTIYLKSENQEYDTIIPNPNYQFDIQGRIHGKAILV